VANLVNENNVGTETFLDAAVNGTHVFSN